MLVNFTIFAGRFGLKTQDYDHKLLLSEIVRSLLTSNTRSKNIEAKFMKYRKLTIEELKELETEFIRFLASNTVTGDEWQKLKAEQPEKAEGLIEIFSDIVFDKIIKDIAYLEMKMPQDYRTFQCLEDKILMLGIKTNGSTSLDFTKNESPAQMMDQIQKSGAQLQLYSGQKSYQPNREQELFKMMENGALISKDGAMYHALNGLKG